MLQDLLGLTLSRGSVFSNHFYNHIVVRYGIVPSKQIHTKMATRRQIEEMLQVWKTSSKRSMWIHLIVTNRSSLHLRSKSAGMQ